MIRWIIALLDALRAVIGMAWYASWKKKQERKIQMREFKFKLPFVVGVILTVIVSVLFPAQAAVSARGFDLPGFLGMPLQDALMWLASSAVLGAFVVWVLGYFNVPPEKAAAIATVVVAVVGAALTAGLKFAQPSLLGMTVYQAVLAIIAYLGGLAGVKVANVNSP